MFHIKVTNIGTFKHLPPILTLKYNFNPGRDVGPAVQGGFDYRVADHWYANVDLKWAMLRAKLKFDSATIATLRVDPVLFAVGLGYRW